MNSETSYKYYNAVLLFCLLSVSVFLLTLQLNRKVLAVRKLLVFLVMPTVETADRVVNYGFSVTENIYGLVKTKQENLRLKRENEQLIMWQSEYEDIQRENQRLRDILGFKSRVNYETVQMSIVSRNASEWFLSCICDKGSDDGIKVDDVVVAVQGQKSALAGRVVEVTPTTSKILLLTDSLSSLAVTSKRTLDDGVVQGKGGLDLTLKYVMPDAAIQPGDELLTTGTAGVFPSGLLVGYITRVSPKSLGDFRTADVMPAVDFSKLRELVVIKFAKR